MRVETAVDGMTEDVIKACVLRVCQRGLLVCDLCSLRELLIQTSDTDGFHPGDRVEIRHNGTVKVTKGFQKVEADQIRHVKQW